MKKEPKNPRRRRGSSKAVIVLSCIAAALMLLIIVMLLNIPKAVTKPVETTAAPVITAAATTEATTVATTEETTVPVETEPVMLDYMAELYEENQDVAGWIKIADTKLDYPVVHTPEDEEKYLYADLDGKFRVMGTPLIDADCSLDPVSDNVLVYGHNMYNGTAFRTLMSYDQKTFWQKHPTFTFSTLYDENEYEIIAAFYDRVYLKSENVFKFYEFIDAENEEDFDYAISKFKEKSLYDTGVTAEYGDKLVTLVTCSYHVDYGRFVVVGKQMPKADAAATAETQAG